MTKRYNLEDLIDAYNLLVKGIDEEAYEDVERAYGGIIRAGKGMFVESITKELVKIAWHDLGGDLNDLNFNKKKIKIPIKKDYVDNLKVKEVKDYIYEHLSEYNYGLSVDVHVFIRDEFVMGIECKAYAENAMIKRILVDFTLLKTINPNLICVLLQLESQLTGDYNLPSKKVIYGSKSTHTLLSYFDIDLTILTLLNGERKVDEPIHKLNHFKELELMNLENALNILKDNLRKYVNK